MIGLVDGNNFYVSCERVFDPGLEGRAVAVLSNNDGCAVSRSQEFKDLGIPMGTPAFRLRSLVASGQVVLRSSNYELYGDLSRRVVATLCEFSNDVEQYSIDEAFLHVDLPEGTDYHAYGRRVRETVLRWVGIPCGVGFAPTKTLAKIANHIGKRRPDGVFVMPGDPAEVLRDLPTEEVWGVGRRLAPKLSALGIRTALHLAQADEGLLRSRFGVTLVRTAMELRGIPAVEHEDADAGHQSVSVSRSFGKPVTELGDLEEAVAHYLAQAAAKLRAGRQRAAGANVYFQYYPEYGGGAGAASPPAQARRAGAPLGEKAWWLRDDGPVPSLPGGFTSTTVAFPAPTSATTVMTAAVRPKLKGIFLPGRRYKKAGVVFFGLESASARQMDLFGNVESTGKAEKVAEVVDAINAKLGRGKIFHLSEGIARPWSMKRELLTPSYTTRWDEILRVR